ncbi:MAG: tRNA uridine-5-carboxymethylaminomethyl(34) synthesis GTPase MnmE [Lachnospiraceae bacterium]|nr:tRNA uridine-5-carboxymethylaminomethyl(34) synthesis GTPase MnmE [Lachnospiraceae bacterium]
MTDNTTIAAVATGAVQAGIGIIRVSGPEAIEVCNKIFINRKGERKLPCYASNTINFGYICEPDEAGSPGEVIDEVLVSVFRAPHSYTAEDTVEINTHGGVFIEKRILELVLEAGARLAEPGEFTKRAFLNGRIDLTRAEAVMDLIASTNEFARKSAMEQLGGALSARIRALREKILHETARIEAALDDPEHYDLTGYDQEISAMISSWTAEIRDLLQGEKEGRIHKEGIRTAIIGRPNAGKSSILNFLTDSGRAIVTDIPGTTRDTLEETVRFGDTQLLLIDTAGIRDSNDPIEKIGISRSKDAVAGADLIFCVIDGTEPLSAEDGELARNIAGILSGSGDIPAVILLVNKSDREQKVSEEEALALYRDAFSGYKDLSLHAVICSAVTGEGIGRVRETVQELFGSGRLSAGQVWVTNSRHISLLNDTLQSLETAKDAAENLVSEDLYVIDLMNAYISLGSIIGEAIGDDLADEIFSSFCMGK